MKNNVIAKTTVYLGLVDKNQVAIDHEKVSDFVTTELMELPGYTTWLAHGAWQDYREPTMVVSCSGNEFVDTMKALAAKYRDEFNQDSVMLDVVESQLQFI